MKSDEQIQQDVVSQLKWNPLLNASEIGVAVKDGIVTLSGQVNTYAKKLEAEKEAKRVAGVKAIAEEIHVGFSPSSKRTDTEIAEAVLNALKWHTSVPDEKITVKVENGIVTLEGEVDWSFQRESARRAVIDLASVRGVFNSITIKKRILPGDLKQKIKAAFHRSATIDANNVEVEVLDNRIVLKGYVRSFAEKEDAERVAWAAPGVLNVENNLVIKDELDYPL